MISLCKIRALRISSSSRISIQNRLPLTVQQEDEGRVVEDLSRNCVCIASTLMYTVWSGVAKALSSYPN
jgi:hypothetical protein